MQEHVSVILVIRAIINYFCRLRKVIFYVGAGEELNSVIKSLHPPIFFKYLNKFKQHIDSWDVNNISDIVDGLIKLEILYKTSKSNSIMVLNHFILTTICRYKS